MTLLDIQDLQVAYRTRRGEEHTAVAGVSLTVEPGEVVAIVGETGSGKTTTAHAVLGLLAPNATVRSGRVLLQGTDISGWSRKRMEAVRGRVVGAVVDSVSDVLELASELIKPAPEMNTSMDTSFITGIASVGERMLILMDIEALMSSPDMGLMDSSSQNLQ